MAWNQARAVPCRQARDGIQRPASSHASHLLHPDMHRASQERERRSVPGLCRAARAAGAPGLRRPPRAQHLPPPSLSLSLSLSLSFSLSVFLSSFLSRSLSLARSGEKSLGHGGADGGDGTLSFLLEDIDSATTEERSLRQVPVT
eukprot:234966-Rhodomonas_salina.2